MSARKFRLATVLRVRRIQEEQARGAVAAARVEVEHAEQEAAARHASAAAVRMPEASAPHAFKARIAHGLALAADAAGARVAVVEKEALAAQRLAEWQATAVRVKPLEHLEEAHRDAVRAADARADQAVGDELAGTRHQRAQQLKAQQLKAQQQQKAQREERSEGAGR